MDAQWRSQSLCRSLGRLHTSADAFTDEFAFELRDGGEDVHQELARPVGLVSIETLRGWEASTEFRPDRVERIAAIDRKIENIRRAVEEGLNDGSWANTRLRELHTERGGRWPPPHYCNGLPTSGG